MSNQSNHKAGIYTGTSNVVLPVPNKQSYPPEYQNKNRLCYYGSLFNSVEVNSTFYKLPLARTITRWAEEVPENFRFTFKLWQEITHQKGLAFNPEDVHRFMNITNHAGDKKGCLLVQMPPSTTVNTFQLNHLINTIKQADESGIWPIAIEFRNRSWYDESVYDLLDEQCVSMVLHDLPASAAPMRLGESNCIYLRFHGPQGGYRGSYADDFLHEYALYVNEWAADGKTVYAYFNNTMGEAVKNLMTFNDYVAAKQ
ncbi:DUF72 domain-containing protein [Mucilaginibacter terrae]|uniref:Uncharacterized protein YecE (DUF72 family) n=1 Tax=Mucilaginibacter terrae TaxID=1955052 RepID=A0ABU3GQT1_9SPHI|nr:DUF72 domain-containing protein [Mucilaginibacter terrae]MDT3402121.1 uncharacterized protein YecE (DUF72 family) [Mucilaginibacter terrae]